MFLEYKMGCSFQQRKQINYNRMAQTMTEMNKTAVTLSANPVVEKCLAKLATEVTEQVRDKLIDILIAVLARECEDFDGESVRRLLVAELETTPLTFAVEKRASGTKTPKEKTPKEAKEKTPKEKKVRAPKEKAPKETKAVVSEEEREARKAAKQAEREAAKEARKAAKQAEREAAKEATKAAKETENDADKEAVKAAKKAKKAVERAAKLAEREAAKTARKAEKDAEREAAKAAKQAEKEAAAAAAPIIVAAPKEQRLPIPWCGRRIEGRCEALRVYHGLFAQCTADATEISAFCPSCEKSKAPFGTCAMRSACGLFDYTDPKGKKCMKLANVVEKFGVEGGLEAFIAEAAKHSITLPAEHLTKEVKQRGRPKSATSPRTSSSKVATSDSGSETETDDEEHKQKRKQVTKVAAASEEAAPKKRGRPAKNPKSDVAPSDEVIQDLVASAAAMSVSSTPSTPVAVTPKSSPVVETPAAPKKAKAVALKAKPVQRKTRVIEEQTFWVDSFNGVEILIRQEDNATFEASNGEPLGFWDDKTKTIIECDEDEDEE
jgi:hypothetical protein